MIWQCHKVWCRLMFLIFCPRENSTMTLYSEVRLPNVIKKKMSRKFPDSPAVRTLRFHCWGPRVPSLVGELGSSKLLGSPPQKRICQNYKLMKFCEECKDTKWLIWPLIKTFFSFWYIQCFRHCLLLLCFLLTILFFKFMLTLLGAYKMTAVKGISKLSRRH